MRLRLLLKCSMLQTGRHYVAQIRLKKGLICKHMVAQRRLNIRVFLYTFFLSPVRDELFIVKNRFEIFELRRSGLFIVMKIYKQVAIAWFKFIFKYFELLTRFLWILR